ncbi:hypothetical protein M0R45_030802 [Rubus argutus]|uniref:Uncharacterized protein n=1 Tax=Rubus argutus TaxID=59490 RepID=A0AAW1WFC1_RUBAR
MKVSALEDEDEIQSVYDVGVCYAFVEFEEISGVHNAFKPGCVQIAGQQLFIEEWRPNSYIPSGVGMASQKGQLSIRGGNFGSWSFGISGDYNGVDQDYSRPRGNGLYRPYGLQDRVNPSYQSSRNGRYSSEY